MLDPVFVRPIAHRGLHDAAARVVENTAPAFAAAIAAGYGIECDLQAAGDGTPMVFHDETLDRLTAERGRVDARSRAELTTLAYRDGRERLLEFGAFLDLVAGRVPLLVEVKSDWSPPNSEFLRHIADVVRGYRGPLALMSFDPAVMAAIRLFGLAVPCGIVSGIYRADGWWSDVLSASRQEALSHLLESRAVAPDFVAYHVDDLPTPVTRYVREVVGLPLFTWTVRRPEQWRVAAQWADAPIFEGSVPSTAG